MSVWMDVIGGIMMLTGIVWLVVFVPYYPKRELKRINMKVMEFGTEDSLSESRIEEIFEELARDGVRRYIHVLIFFGFFAVGVAMVYLG